MDLIKDLGPCFGINGHSRRDTDVISRLSKSTIEDLSFYIGFVKDLMVKTIVYDDCCMTLIMCSNPFRFFLIRGSYWVFLDIENHLFVIEKSICL